MGRYPQRPGAPCSQSSLPWNMSLSWMAMPASWNTCKHQYGGPNDSSQAGIRTWEAQAASPRDVHILQSALYPQWHPLKPPWLLSPLVRGSAMMNDTDTGRLRKLSLWFDLFSQDKIWTRKIFINVSSNKWTVLIICTYVLHISYICIIICIRFLLT